MDDAKERTRGQHGREKHAEMWQEGHPRPVTFTMQCHCYSRHSIAIRRVLINCKLMC
jgi:hypothetical protein